MLGRDFQLVLFPCQRIDTILRLVIRENTFSPCSLLTKGKAVGATLSFYWWKKELLSLVLFDIKNTLKNSDKNAVAIVENAFLHFNSYYNSHTRCMSLAGLLMGYEEEDAFI